MWSLYYAFLCIWPYTDHIGRVYDPKTPEGQEAGHDLASGFCLVVFAFKGDLDHLTKAWGLRSYGSQFPCQWCPCGRKQVAPLMKLNYFGSDAEWKDKFYSVSEWRNVYTSFFYIFEMQFITHHNIQPDELHVMHLGTSMYMLGSVLSMLVTMILDDSIETNMEHVWDMISDYYIKNSVITQYTNIDLNMFQSDGAKKMPKLSGKGAEIKDLVPALLHVWKELRDHTLFEHQLVESMLQAQCAIQDILAE